MAMVIRVRFKRASKLYDFDPNGLDLHNGMHVVTETARGVELGECATGILDLPDENVVLPLKPIMRIATEQDLQTQKKNEEAEKEAFDIAVERIAEHELEMKLVDVEYAFDRSKIIFYFTANGRVDFRMLVKNLAGIFKTRIELRQIGVRDEAKMLGGIGPCGRQICCRTFLSDFTPVSIKMAKEQNLSLNPTKISGLCDRLMCCLKYEQDHYEVTRKRMPRVGREIITPDGPGTINAINVLEETVRVRIAVGDSFELRVYPIDDCQRLGEADRAARHERAEAKAEEKAAARTEEISVQEGAAQEANLDDQEVFVMPPVKADRPPRQERAHRGEGRPKGERGARPDGQPRPEKPAKGERGTKNERGPRPERAPKGERPQRGERPERPAKPERPRQERPVRREMQKNAGEAVIDIREESKPQDLL